MQYKSKAREIMVQQFIQCLKEDEIPWEKPWIARNMINPVTSKEYTGYSNILMLQFSASEKNWKDHRWCTYAQAQDKGWHIRAGEKGTRIEFWSSYDKEAKKLLSIGEVNKLLQEAPNAKERIRIIAKSYVVFNGEQIEGIPALENTNLDITPSGQELLKKVETIAGGMGVPIKNTGNLAVYMKKKDEIHMPAQNQFKSLNDYTSVLLHELAHSTGHTSRMNRATEGDSRTEAYAKEELRAEIASAFMMSSLNLEFSEQHMDNHKAYIQSWISILENNPDELFLAIKDAGKIADYMMELCPEKISEKKRDFTEKNLEDRIGTAKEKKDLDSNSIQHKPLLEREIA